MLVSKVCAAVNTLKDNASTDFQANIYTRTHSAHNDSLCLSGLWNRDVWGSFN